MFIISVEICSNDIDDIVFDDDDVMDIIVIMSGIILIWAMPMRNDCGRGERVGLECKKEGPPPKRRRFKNGMIIQKLSEINESMYMKVI